jgi:hypothetical protein
MPSALDIGLKALDEEGIFRDDPEISAACARSFLRIKQQLLTLQLGTS